MKNKKLNRCNRLLTLYELYFFIYYIMVYIYIYVHARVRAFRGKIKFISRIRKICYTNNLLHP